ncbi:MAG: type II toxin-antitoxin system VapB family antitoxin [Acidobacteria bacterium]|nr:type II toxin-antitoxin system VapB family antitoxin [Acidobacteriota bacterium]
MRTNIDIPDKLLRDVMKGNAFPSKRAAVIAGLETLARLRLQEGIRKLRGKIEFDPDYDYKAMRQDRFPDWSK